MIHFLVQRCPGEVCSVATRSLRGGAGAWNRPPNTIPRGREPKPRATPRGCSCGLRTRTQVTASSAKNLRTDTRVHGRAGPSPRTRFCTARDKAHRLPNANAAPATTLSPQLTPSPRAANAAIPRPQAATAPKVRRRVRSSWVVVVIEVLPSSVAFFALLVLGLAVRALECAPDRPRSGDG